MNYLLLGILLIAQNASFTLVSRARNSKSIFYHSWASVLSNGIWFVSQFVLVEKMFKVITGGVWSDAIPVGLFYVACTMTGSIGMHWLALHKIEKEKNVQSTNSEKVS